MSSPPPDPRYLLRGDMGCVHSVLFRINSNVEHIYAGTSEGKVHVWDLKKNREVTRSKLAKDSCLSLRAFGRDNLLVQQKGGSVHVLSISESRLTPSTSFNVDYCTFCRCQVLRDDTAVFALKDSVVGLFSLRTFNVEQRLDPTNDPALSQLGETMAIAAIEDANQILVAYEGGTLALWDLRKQTVLTRVKIDSCPMTLDYDAYSRKGIVGGPSDKLQIFACSPSDDLCVESEITLKNPGTSVVSVRPDRKIVTAGGWDGGIRIFSWKSRKHLATLTRHRDTVHDVAYSSCEVRAYDDKRLIAACGRDAFVSLWDIYN